MFSKTTALPLCLNNEKEAADGFTTAPLGAKFPLTTAIPESNLKGSSKVEMILLS